jgi:hypothetical protein
MALAVREAVEIGAMNGTLNGVERVFPGARKVNGIADGIEQQIPGDFGATREDLAAALAATARRVKVVEVGTGIEHQLPGDTPTRDARALASLSFASGAVLPLVIRSPEAAFYVCGEQRLELCGKLVRRCP